MCLGQRAQNHADDHGRRRKTEAPHQHAQQTDAVEQEQVKRALAHAVGAHGGKNQDARVQLLLGYLEQLDPQAHHGQVQHQQHQVADVERCDQRPHQRRRRGEQLRPGVDAVVLEGAQQHRCGVGGGNAQRQQRYQRRRHGGVVGGLGAGHAFNRTFFAKLGLVVALGQLFLGGVAQERRNLGAACRNAAKGRANHRAAQPRGDGALPVARRHVNAAHGVARFDHAALVHGGIQHLGHGKQAHGHQHDVDAVQQLDLAAGVARRARNLVHPNAARRQPDKQRRDAAHRALAQHRAHGGKGQHHQHEVFGRAQAHGKVGHVGRKQRHHHGGDGARHERADGRRGQRRTRAAVLGHLVALHGGDHAGRLAGGVEQNRGGRAAVHGAVVNAREEDHRGRDLDLGRDGQQHGHSHRRANAGQHAHCRTQGAAKQRPEQVDGRGGGGKARQECVQYVHHSHPVCVSPGKLIAKSLVKAQNTGAEISTPVSASTAQTRALEASCPLARRRPCTASR